VTDRLAQELYYRARQETSKGSGGASDAKVEPARSSPSPSHAYRHHRLPFLDRKRYPLRRNPLLLPRLPRFSISNQYPGSRLTFVFLHVIVNEVVQIALSNLVEKLWSIEHKVKGP
jgi:hypothetical protein